MSITIGSGPFGKRPAGIWNFEPPEEVVYVEAFPRRVRAELGNRTVVDSRAVKLVFKSDELARYSFPADDVELDAAPDPLVDSHVIVEWSEVDRWFEEDEEVFVHPRDPYHRIDTFATSRHVRVSLDGSELASSQRALALYETALPVRWYLPSEDVRMDLLVSSDTVTRCAYKGTARHWSARLGDGEDRADIAWGYGHAEVWREGEPVRDRICFYNEKIDLEIDGEPQERAVTRFSSRPTGWLRTG